MSSPLGGLPRPPMFDGGNFTPAWAGWWTTANIILQDASNSGSSSQRPMQTLYVGKPFFDTTLGKPIWVQSLSPTVWCDATGAAV